MSQSYVKECIFCNKKIRMSDQIGKWLPFNEDGSQHECNAKNGNNNKTSKSAPNIGNEDLSLEVVLKKLESIGITIELQKLRNAINGATK